MAITMKAHVRAKYHDEGSRFLVLPIHDSNVRWRRRVQRRSPIVGRSEKDHFSPREAQILRLIADGHTDKEVAAALGISLKTVGTHLGRIYRRLGMRSRTEAVVALLRTETDEVVE